MKIYLVIEYDSESSIIRGIYTKSDGLAVEKILSLRDREVKRVLEGIDYFTNSNKDSLFYFKDLIEDAKEQLENLKGNDWTKWHGDPNFKIEEYELVEG